MSRVQLALNVDDIAAAVDFYSKLFATKPAKLRPGYANFAIADPPLKLVLIEDANQVPGTVNHLGVEVLTTEEVMGARSPGGRGPCHDPRGGDNVLLCRPGQGVGGGAR